MSEKEVFTILLCALLKKIEIQKIFGLGKGGIMSLRVALVRKPWWLSIAKGEVS